MAITIHQKPTSVYDSYAAFDPCIYVVAESTIGPHKFSYTCVIEHYDGSAYVNLATLRIPKNSEDCGVFDISGVVRAALNPTAPGVTGTELIDLTSDQSGRFKMTFGSEQALTANSAPVANASTAVEEFVFYSGSRHDPLEGYSENQFSDFALAGTNRRMLTTNAFGTDTVRIEVRDDEKGFLQFLSQQTTLPATSFDIVYFNGSTQLSSTNVPIPAVGQDYELNILTLYCYPYGLNNDAPASARPNDAGNNGWTRYVITAKRGGLTFSLGHEFVRKEFCEPHAVKFQWLNEYGGYEHIWCKGLFSKRQTLETTGYTRTRGNWNEASASTNFGYTEVERGQSQMVTKTTRSFRTHTGMLPENENTRIESLMRSRDVRCTKPGSESDDLYPCVIETKTLNLVESFSGDNIEYSFDFVLANQPKTMVV